MTLSTRLTLTMTVLVVATATVIWALAYTSITSGVVPVALEELKSSTGLLARGIQGPAGAVIADVRAIRHAPAVAAIVATSEPGATYGGWDNAQWRALLARRFSAEMESKGRYLQIRLIGYADGGRELVRVERALTGGPLRIVAADELQRKGDRPYVAATKALRVDEVHASEIDYNNEFGRIASPHVPVLRFSTPVNKPNGEPFGLVIINLDMEPIFAGLRNRKAPRSNIYIINEHGDYLLHPDRSREFGFENGHPFRIDDEFPSLASLMTSGDDEGKAQIVDLGDRRAGVAVWPITIAGDRRIFLLSMVPEEALSASVIAVRNSSLIGGGIAVVVAVFAAFVVARSLAEPLSRMTAALSEPRTGQTISLPVNAGGEIGELAKAIYRAAEVANVSAAAIAFSDDAVVDGTLDGYITSWNATAEALLGYTASEAIGRHLSMLVPPERRGELREIREKILKGERIENFKTVRLAADGRPVEVLLTISPVRSPEGEIVGLTAIGRDAKSRLVHEKRIRELQIEAAHAERLNAAGEMAASIAHEINQPLAAVANYIGSADRRLSQDGAPDIDKVRGYLDKALQQVNRAGYIIRNLRGFVGSREPRMHDEDVAQVVDEALDLAMTAMHGVPIHRRIAQDLPPVTMEKGQIQQVMLNLVRNAVEAMEGRSDAEITVTVDRQGDGPVRITVSDNGPGLPQDRLTNLFQPFKSSKAKGMGIGLMICKSIIETHNGRMWPENNPNGGASIHFSLPVDEHSDVGHAA